MSRIKQSNFRKLAAAAALLLTFALASGSHALAQQGVPGLVAEQPAATLLLPYFEVDLSNSTPAADTTIISITNTSATALLNHVTIWTDLGVPALEFNVYLTGYDLWRLNLQQLLITGQMPATASAGQDPTNTISPKGQKSQDINFASCSGQLPLPTLPALQVSGLQAALTGHASVNYGPNLCGGVNHGDNIARGFITIDTVNNCTTRFPSEAGYIQDDITFQNVLIGDVFYLNPAQNRAVSAPLISLVASLSDPALTTVGSYTFYGKYDGFDGSDHRQPTSTTYAARYVNAGSPQGLNFVNQGTTEIVWRDAKITQNPFACNTTPSWYPLTVEGMDVFDEQEHVQIPAFCVQRPCPVMSPLLPYPAQTQKTVVGGPQLPTSFNAGWLYLDLNTTVTGQSASLTDQAAAQASVFSLYDQGVGGGGNNPNSTWEMGEKATGLDSAENANHFVP